MNVCPDKTRELILRCLCEGMSVRSAARTAAVGVRTVSRMLLRAGEVCSRWQHHTVRGLVCDQIQVDEIWSFVYAKDKALPDAKSPPRVAGTVWLFTAIDPVSKIMPSWLVGGRDVETATEFLQDLKSRLVNSRVQLTSDGLKAYPEAVQRVFGRNVDYAVLEKQYEGKQGNRSGLYSGCLKIIVSGSPNLDRISTSFMERANLTIRQNNRRYTRKSTGFSKRLRNHCASVSLGLAYYNLVRPHQTLSRRYRRPTTPAMAAGLANAPFHLRDILTLIDEVYGRQGPRAAYGPRRPVGNVA